MNMMNKFHKSGHKTVKTSGFVQFKQFGLMEQFEFIWNDFNAYLEILMLEGLLNVGVYWQTSRMGQIL